MGKMRVTHPAIGRKLVRAVGTSGLVLSSGYFAWQIYTLRTASTRPEPVGIATKKQYVQDQIEYVDLPPPVYERLKLVDPVEAKEELMSLIPKHLRKPWKLLRQANHGSYEQHLKAVKELSSLALSDGEYQQLAQSCDMRTTIGLARSKNVDLRFFLKPAPLPPNVQENSILKLMQQVLEELPKGDVHECVRSFTVNALSSYVCADEETIWDQDLEQEFHRESHHILKIPRKRYSLETLLEYCLQALLAHSDVESHCFKMIQTNMLPLMSKIVEEYPDNPRIKSIIGKILSNIALYPEAHDAIFNSGWIGVLAAWKQDPNLLVTLPATKALCNLDQEFGHVYEQGVYLLLPNDRFVQHKNELSNWGVDIVFLHGLLGGVFYTWRQSDPMNEKKWFKEDLVSTDEYSYCWPRDWLQSVSDNVRVLGVDFDTYLSQWGTSCTPERTCLNDRSQDMLERLRKSGIGERPVIFVGHSMGGLIIKKMLTLAHQSENPEDRKFASNTKGIVFYSTPHGGSGIAKMNATTRFLFFPTTEVQELEAGSHALSDLHQNFCEMLKTTKTKIVSFGELRHTAYLGLDLTFVPPESADPGFGEFYALNENHINICKPDSTKSILFRKFMNLVWDALDDASPYLGS